MQPNFQKIALNLPVSRGHAFFVRGSETFTLRWGFILAARPQLSSSAIILSAKERHLENSNQLDEAIVTALRRIIRAIDLHSRELLVNYGLTAPQLLTLQELDRLQPTPVGTLAAAVHISQATMTGILDRLEQRSLVERTRDVQDRRSVTVTLTREGKKFLQSAPSLLQDRFRTRLDELEPWEQTTMLSVLQRIAMMMGAETLVAAPILISGPEPLSMPETNGTAAAAKPAKTKVDAGTETARKKPARAKAARPAK
jgi:DNA-binding MarR family transcriptional regulator